MKAINNIVSISFTICFLFCFNITDAQKLSAGVLGGYSFAPWGSVIGVSDVYESSSNGYEKNIKGSFGEGISYGINISYKVCQHVAVNLDALMIHGRNMAVPQSDYFAPDITPDSATYQTNITLINPGVIFTCNEDKKIQPFAKAEVVFGLFSKLDKFTPGNTHPNSGNYEELQLSGGMGLGFGVALGSYYKLSNHFSISAALSGIHLPYGYTKGEVIKYTSNGIDKLSTLSVSEKQLVYQDKVNYDNSNDPNSPTVEPKQYYPFSQVGIEIGLKYTF